MQPPTTLESVHPRTFPNEREGEPPQLRPLPMTATTWRRLAAHDDSVFLYRIGCAEPMDAERYVLCMWLVDP